MPSPNEGTFLSFKQCLNLVAFSLKQGESSHVPTAEIRRNVEVRAFVFSPYNKDLWGSCEKWLIACPTRALEPYKLKITRCMTYSAESPQSPDVPDDVRKLERMHIAKPTANSYTECATCVDICPVGKPRPSDR